MLSFESGSQFGEDDIADDELTFATRFDKSVHPCLGCWFGVENRVNGRRIDSRSHFFRETGTGPRVSSSHSRLDFLRRLRAVPMTERISFSSNVGIALRNGACSSKSRT